MSRAVRQMTLAGLDDETLIRVRSVLLIGLATATDPLLLIAANQTLADLDDEFLSRGVEVPDEPA